MLPTPTNIYHITSVKSLSSIIAQGGLWSYNEIHKRRIDYINIAHQGIQDRRATKLVPCGPGGTLHDYIPFYFAPRSPMLYAIECGKVEGYEEKQKPVIHLVANVYSVTNADQKFVFTDGHGIMAFTEFYDSLDYLDKVDWEIMEARYWFDTNTDNDRKRRRQAEFLVYEFFPWELFQEIGVINSEIQKQVAHILRDAKHQPKVSICPHWYY